MKGHKSSGRDAYHVSKALRRAGYKIGYAEHRYRKEGVFVKNAYRRDGESQRARIIFDFDPDKDCRGLFDDMTQTLVDLGYTVEAEWDEYFPAIRVSKTKGE